MITATLWGNFVDAHRRGTESGDSYNRIPWWRRQDVGKRKVPEFRTIWGPVNMQCTGPLHNPLGIKRRQQRFWPRESFGTIWGTIGSGRCTVDATPAHRVHGIDTAVRTIWGTFPLFDSVYSIFKCDWCLRDYHPRERKEIEED